MIDLEKIEKLMELMVKHGIDNVQAESGKEKFTLSKNNIVTANNTAVQPINHVETVDKSANVSQIQPVHDVIKASPAGETISSPFVGTFYRSANPDVPPFVSIGAKVKKGQTLCIVEAMKLMNEIECEIDGEIVDILVENARPVEFGTPLFIIAPAK